MAESTSMPISTIVPTSEPTPNEPFQSILPTLDSILEILLSQTTSQSPPSSIEAAGQVANKAKELATILEEMRKGALNLPGGNMSLETIQRRNERLDTEIEKRKNLLLSFGRSEMGVIDLILRDQSMGGALGGGGGESVMPSPANGSS